MSWLRKLFGSSEADSSSKADSGPVYKISSDLPVNVIEEAASELTTMLGVSMIYAFDKNDRLLFEYKSWMQEEAKTNPKGVLKVIHTIRDFMRDDIDNPLTNAILRSEGANIIIQMARNIVIYVQTVENINLALISIRVRRVAMAISKIFGGE